MPSCRLGRSRDYVIHLVNSFRQRGIHFKALDLSINTTTPAGKFMLFIFASLVEYDRESILEKAKAGQQLAAAQGKHIGRPKGLDAENIMK
jgi:DNA invertase Pin-like site-specific DNA recombinase